MLPAFDLFWYDGGMKPFIPEELKEDKRDMPEEGMMFVGDKGKILAGFRGERSRDHSFQAHESLPGRERSFLKESGDPVQIPGQQPSRDDKESPGSFKYAGTGYRGHQPGSSCTESR